MIPSQSGPVPAAKALATTRNTTTGLNFIIQCLSKRRATDSAGCPAFNECAPGTRGTLGLRAGRVFVAISECEKIDATLRRADDLLFQAPLLIVVRPGFTTKGEVRGGIKTCRNPDPFKQIGGAQGIRLEAENRQRNGENS